MPTIFGCDFWGGTGALLEKQGRQIGGKNSLEEFAEKSTGNFPKSLLDQYKKSPQIRSAQARDQHVNPFCRPSTPDCPRDKLSLSRDKLGFHCVD